MKSSKTKFFIKGSMRRLAPFDPKKEPTKELNAWASHTGQFRAESKADLREKIPQASPAALMRIKNKLHRATKVRRNPETGEREFLLFRGVGKKEMESAHKGDKISHDKMTSWTPKFFTAADFAEPEIIPKEQLPEWRRGYTQDSREQAKHHASRGNMKSSGILAAWIPESAIHNSPDQHNIKMQHWAFKELGLQGGNENEIIVKPHTSDAVKQHEYFDSIEHLSGDPIKDSPLKKEIEYAVWSKKQKELWEKNKEKTDILHFAQGPDRGDRQATAYHVAALRGRRPIQPPPDLTEEQRQRLENYAKVLESKYKKPGGEGSRGGIIVGHTPKGNPIYESQVRRSMITESELEVFKALQGEGSRGGRVIGHTKSGKPIYESGFHHESVKHYSVQDHKDAARLHMGYAEFLDPHPEEGGGGFWHEPKDEKFDPAHNQHDYEKRAKHHREQAAFHTGHVRSETGFKPAAPDIHPYIERSMHKDKIHGGLADKKKPKDFDKKQLAAGKKVESEHTSDPKIAEEIAMDHLSEDPKYYVKLKQIEKKSEGFFIFDVMKSMEGQPRPGHKYLRRYKRGDKWIYVYHEAGQHGRRVDDSFIEAMKRLAATGYQPAKDLLDSIQEHNEEKLNMLRRLADTGYKPAHEHLKTLGIDRDLERVEEATRTPDKVTDDLSEADMTKALDAIRDAANPMFARWVSHPGSRFETGASAVGLRNTEDLINYIKEQSPKSIKDILIALNKKMSEMDAHHVGHTPSFDAAKNAGGYANMVYNNAVKKLEADQLLPRNYNEVHKRTRENAATLAPHDEADHKTRMAELEARRAEEERQRIERERIERERREEEERRISSELEGSMASYMNSILQSPLSSSRTLELHRALSNMFGKNMRKEDFPYQWEGHETKITSLSFTSNSVVMHMQIYRNGRPIMEGFKREWEKDGSRLHIHNSYMAVLQSERDGSQIGNRINQAQRNLIRSLPNGGYVTVTANIDIGGYTWANQGFRFASTGVRENFRAWLRNKGITLTDDEFASIKYPCHIAQFTNGKKRLRSIKPIPLSPMQKAMGNIEGVEGGRTTLTSEEISSGETSRMFVHLGKDYLLDINWRGIWDSNDDNEATRFADNYYNLRNSASSLLSETYQNTLARIKEGRPASDPTPTVAPTATPVAPAPDPTSVQAHAAHFGISEGDVRYVRNLSTGRWRPRGSRRTITMNEQRLREIATWSSGKRNYFVDLNWHSLTSKNRRLIRSASALEQYVRTRDYARERAQAASARERTAAQPQPEQSNVTEYGPKIESKLNNISQIGNAILLARDHWSSLSVPERARIKEKVRELWFVSKRRVGTLQSAGVLPDNYTEMTGREQQQYFIQNFGGGRFDARFEAARQEDGISDTKEEMIEAITNFGNLSHHKDVVDQIVGGSLVS